MPPGRHRACGRRLRCGPLTEAEQRAVDIIRRVRTYPDEVAYLADTEPAKPFEPGDYTTDRPR